MAVINVFDQLKRRQLFGGRDGSLGSNRVGLGAFRDADFHLEKLISSHSLRAQRTSFRSIMPIICCVTLMIFCLQILASLCIKPEVDKGFVPPPTYLSGILSLYPRTLISLSLGVWNRHPDLIHLLGSSSPDSHLLFLTLYFFLHMLLSLSCVLLTTLPSPSILS